MRRFCRHTFGFWERVGIHVLPVDFYQPVPDLRSLGDRPWSKPSALVGVRMEAEGQLHLLDRIKRFQEEYEAIPRKPASSFAGFYLENGQFESVDAEVLYAMLRLLRPKRMFEIGSGFSTLLSSVALRRNHEEDGWTCAFTACDPEPRTSIRSATEDVAQLVRLPVQMVPLERFTELGDGDVLFIDSSHVLATGSDVQFEYLEILPRLRPGVYVHVHDIFLPDEYPRAWVLDEHRFWTEQYLLQAFLTFNDTFDVLWAGSWMHRHHSAELKSAFTSYRDRPHGPGSFWLRRRS